MVGPLEVCQTTSKRLTVMIRDYLTAMVRQILKINSVCFFCFLSFGHSPYGSCPLYSTWELLKCGNVLTPLKRSLVS